METSPTSGPADAGSRFLRSLPLAGRVFLPVAAFALLVGCSSATDTRGASDAWSTTADTLADGTPLVVNTPPAGESGARYHLVEELRIGTMEGGGPASFGQLKGLVVTEDGLVAVLDGQAQEIRVFDRDGNHVATHGGAGEGPGEFLNGNGLMLNPDGLLVVPDQRQQRMTFLHPRNGLERTQAIVQTGYAWVYTGAMLADGRIVRQTSYPGATIDDPRTYYLRIFSPDATEMDSVFIPEQYAGMDREDPPTSFSWSLPGGRGGGVMGITFAEQGSQLLHPEGTIWSSEMGADMHRMVQTSLDMSDTLRVVETRRSAMPVPEQVRDAEITRIRETISEYGGDIGNQSWDKVPTRYPFIERIVAGADGTLWVETGTESGSLWDVFDAEGRHLRTIETDLEPYRWVAPVIRGDEVWAVVTDEYDVGYVVRARVVEGVAGG